MRNISTHLSVIFITISLLFASCSSMNNTQKGAGIGTAAGAAAGAAIGSIFGEVGVGAAIGTAVGGVAGGIIGNKMDKQATEIQNSLPGAEVERVGEGIRVVLNENSINFDFNSATLTDMAKANLDKIIPALNSEVDTNLLIQGYTDSKGSDDYNLKLSEQRAQAVYSYLVSHGIADSRLKTEGLGEQNPIASNDTDAGRAKNRRVEFIITANDKMKKDAEAEAQAQQSGNQ